MVEEQEERLPSAFIIPLILFFVGLLLFIALLTGQNDLTVFTCLVIFMALGANIWSRLSLSRIKCDLGVDSRKVFPGETITVTLKAENAKLLPVRLRMKLPLEGPLQPSGEKSILTAESGLLWFQRASFARKIAAPGRGWHRLGPPHMSAGDLFGFFNREKTATRSLHITVYPRLVPLKTFLLPRREFYGNPGVKNPVPDPVYLQGTRDYQHWRPARYIHWKASARHNRLQEKIFEPSGQKKILLAVEVDRFAGRKADGDFERTLETAASLAARLERQGCPTGLVTNGHVAGGISGVLPIAGGPQQLSAILEVLARLQMRPLGNLLDMAHRGSNLPWGVSCVFFLYEKNDITPAIEGFFNRRQIPVVFIVGRASSTFKEAEHGIRSDIYHLDEICMERHAQ